MALAVGMANSEVEFVFPTSEEMGHSSLGVSPNTSHQETCTCRISLMSVCM